jgi:hypothetical protein
MENENILCVKVWNRGNEIYGTSFNPNEITEEKFLSKITFDGYIDFFDLADDEQTNDEQTNDEQTNDEQTDDEQTDDEQTDDEQTDISDYYIDSELPFNNMMMEIELNNKTIFEQDNVSSHLNIVELEAKDSYKVLINPPENEVCVLWFENQHQNSTFYWNNILDFDINKLKIYCSTRFNEIESKEFKLFSGLTYDDKEPDNDECEGEPGSGIDGPYTF